MRVINAFFSIALSASLLLACSGNNATNSGKDSTLTIASSASGSGDDMYYESTTISKGEDISINGVTKMYVSSKGDMRSEMNLSNSFKGNNRFSLIVLIGHSGKPDESILIDDSAKTYTINHIGRHDLDTKEKTESSVTKISDRDVIERVAKMMEIFPAIHLY